MKNQFISYLLLLLTTSVFSQDALKWIQPTPNSFSFAKYGEIPVSMYTGVPNISVPITSLKLSDIETFVSLSYHGSGIKVDEIASWVGLGWNLNAGGCITRAINGQPEYPDPVTGLIKPTRNNLGFPEPDNPDGRFSNLTVFQNARLTTSDLEPDIYYYNFAGETGKFVLDENGTPRLIKQKAWSIKFLPCYPGDQTKSLLSKFVITVENGTKYEFAERDCVPYDVYGTWAVGAWYLTKITSPLGNEITFEYSSSNAQQYTHSKTYSLVYANYMAITDENDDPTPQANLLEKEVFLTKIKTTNAGWIEFKQNKISANIRKDYYSQQCYPLDEIVVYDANNTAIKRYKFYTSYFTAPNYVTGQFSAISSPWTSIQHLRYRLKLDSLKESSGDNLKTIPAYKFKYYNDLNSTLYNLPYRLSPNQDHWGYYNNASNSFMAPHVNWNVYACYWFDTFDGINDDIYFHHSGFSGGADREPNLEAVKACVLNRLYYPTGGYTEFEFESNDYSEIGNAYTGGGIRIKSIKNYTNSSSLIKHKQYIYKNFDFETKQISTVSSGFLADHPRNYYVTPGKVICGTGAGPNGDIKVALGYPSSSACFYKGSDHTYNFVYKISALPLVTLGSAYIEPVGYSTVIEKEIGNGYSVSYFTGSEYPNFVDEDCFDYTLNSAFMFQTQYSTSITSGGYWGSLMQRKKVNCNEWPYLPPFEFDWKRGLIKGVSYYDNNNNLLKGEDNEYNFSLLQIIPGYKVYSVDDAYSTQFIHGKYLISSNWVSLKQKIVFDFTSSGTTTKTTRYYYKNDSYKLLDKETFFTNVNDSIETKYKYPSDINLGVYASMKTLNMLNYPTEVVSVTNNNVISSKLTTYKVNGSSYVPDKVYSLETATPIASSSFSAFNGSTKDSRYGQLPELSFDDYNPNGTVRQLTGRDGITTAYLWDAAGSYPMAQVKGATYEQVKAYNGQSVTTDSQTLYNNIKSLVPNAFITTFAYKPLIGLSSQTDPAGRKTKYEYDDFGRLKLVKDLNQNIVKKMEYHYAGQ